MANSLTNKEKAKEELTVVFDADGEQIKLTPSIVQNYIVGANNGKITKPEFMMFTSLCKARHLNPFLKEAYCIKYGDNPAQIVVGKDAVHKRAIRNANYDGMESGIIVRNNETGDITERKGTFYLKEQETLVGGWARAFRKDWQHPTYCSVSFDEVAQKKGSGQLNSNWATKGATMVEKVAKVRALRETFVEEVGGMYEADELGIDLPNEEPINDAKENQPSEEFEAPATVINDPLA